MEERTYFRVNKQWEDGTSIEGHIEDSSLQKALGELGFHTQRLDILGVYEAHKFRFKK